MYTHNLTKNKERDMATAIDHFLANAHYDQIYTFQNSCGMYECEYFIYKNVLKPNIFIYILRLLIRITGREFCQLSGKSLKRIFEKSIKYRLKRLASFEE